MKVRLYQLITLLLICWYPVQSQVELVAHPNQDTTPLDGIYYSFYEFQGKVFFKARDNIGYALYRTDGNPEGTSLITRDFDPQGFTSCGDYLYVFGSKAQYDDIYNPFGQYAIWRMMRDGSGIQKMVDIYRPMGMWGVTIWSVSDRVYFSRNGGLSWIDHLTGKVTMVYQGISSGSATDDFIVEKKTMVDGGMFFLGSDHSPQNLFYTDFTKEGTVGLATIKTDDSCIPYDVITQVNNRCFVLHVADTIQLWESDGTTGGTAKIWENEQAAVNPGQPYPSVVIENQGELIFDIPERVNDTLWHSIYSYMEGKVQLVHHHPYGYLNIRFVKHPDGIYLFVKVPAEPNLLEVWLKDGAGYRQMATIDLPVNTSNLNSVYWQNNKFVILAGHLFMYDDQNFNLLFSTDIFASSVYSTNQGYFFTRTDNLQVLEPWVLKTDPISCSLVKKLPTDLRYGAINSLTPVGDNLYFAADSKELRMELWTTTGTSESTHLVKEINESGSTNPFYIRPFSDKIVFTSQGEQGYLNMDNYDFSGLWISDGTAEGTIKLEDLMIKEDGGHYSKVVCKDKIYFIGKSKSVTDTQWRLWVSDGQQGSARIFDEQFSDLHFSNIYDLKAVGTKLYFIGSQVGESKELWVTDGTEPGTRSIDDMIGDDNYSYNTYVGVNLAPAGSKLFFTRDRLHRDQSASYYFASDVWVTDGTPEGSRCIADFGDGIMKNSLLKFIGIHQEKLMFTYSTPGDGFELWCSGGDRSNTVRLTGFLDTKPDNDKSYSGGVSLGEQFFFTSFTEENGYELWVTDGTQKGTHLFFELGHAQKSTYPKGLTVVGDKLLFFAEIEGIESPLWISNGTYEGTEPLPWNFAPLNNFKEVILWKNALYFVASHPESGQGLYRYDLSAISGRGDIEKRDLFTSLNLYPNPAESFLNIALASSCTARIHGKLLSSKGQILKEFIIENGSTNLPIGDLPPGIYFIQVGESNKPFIKK